MHLSLSGLFFGQPGEDQPQTDLQEENSRYVSGKSFQQIFLFVEITGDCGLTLSSCGLGSLMIIYQVEEFDRFFFASLFLCQWRCSLRYGFNRTHIFDPEHL